MFEDAILPDDFGQETDLPQSEVVTDETPVETELDTNPTDETEEINGQEPVQAEQSPFLKIKYNKEEMELDEATARELAQKGLNYDKQVERLQQLESDPRLSFIKN
jgi:hypothetical protein